MATAPKPSAESPSAARRPWVAFLLSLLAPGLGHLYAGSPIRAFAAVCVWAAFTAGGLWLFVRPFGPPAIWLGTALLIFGLVAVAGHAALSARHGAAIDLNRALRVVVYGIYLVSFSAAASFASSWIRADLSETFRVSSGSMFPTLRIGDHIVADKRAYRDRSPQPGEVVIFWAARDGNRVWPADSRRTLPREQFVARIIGAPGDRIRVAGSSVYQNGFAIQDSYVGSATDSGRALKLFAQSLGGRSYVIAKDPAIPRTHMDEIAVSPDRYFVMGDNRDHANDSRFWGTVARSDIVARVSHLYFPGSDDGGLVDWGRIGQWVQ